MTKSSWGISDVGRLERHQGKVEKERPGLVVTHYDFTSFLKRLRYEVLLSVRSSVQLTLEYMLGANRL